MDLILEQGSLLFLECEAIAQDTSDNKAPIISLVTENSGLDSDADDADWEPQPVDANVAGLHRRHRRSANLTARVLRIFQTPELPIRTFQSSFAERLLSLPSADAEHTFPLHKQITELESVFGEAALEHCAIMLADVKRSQKLSKKIVERANLASPLAVDVRWTVISRLFWPQQADEKAELPPELGRVVAQHNEAFGGLLSKRKLQVLPHAGTVEIQVQRESRVDNYAVTPAQYAILSHVAENGDVSLDDIVARVKVSQANAKKALRFWTSEGVVEEYAPQRFRPRENGADFVQDTSFLRDEDEGDAAAEMQRPIVTMFVDGMLRNQGPLGLDTIHNRLTMLCDEYTWSKSELLVFLNGRIAEEKLTKAGELFKLVPPSG